MLNFLVSFFPRAVAQSIPLLCGSTGEIITDSETGEVLQGKKAFIIEYLRTHDTFREKYLAMIKEFISASNDKSVLDKESLKAIEAEEDAIERPQEDEAKRKILLEDM